MAIGLHDRFSCFDQRISWLQRVCGEQGGAARIRTRVAQRTQGQEYPGERAAPRGDRHTDAGPGSHRGSNHDPSSADDHSDRRNSKIPHSEAEALRPQDFLNTIDENPVGISKE
jgi:hypothetical protein